MMNRVEILNLLPAFVKKFTHGKFEFYRQMFDRSYETAQDQKPGLGYFRINNAKNPDVLMNNQDWLKHFSTKPDITTKYVYGSYAISGAFEKGVVKWVAFDADNEEESRYVMDSLIPFLEKEQIHYILEFSRAYRCHVWIFFDSIPSNVVYGFIGKIKELTGGTTQEVYPFGARKNSPIRIPCGWHYWSKKHHECQYGDQISDNPATVMKWIIDIPVVTLEKIQQYYQPLSEEQEGKRRRKRDPNKFKYIPRNLPLPFPDMPEVPKAVCGNCQAYNKLFQSIPKEGGIDIPGAQYHQTGMRCSGVTLYHDIVKDSKEGRAFFAGLERDYRSRDGKSHQWNGDKNFEKYYENPQPLIASCKKMQEEFAGICDGCPYLNMAGLTSPRQFYEGTTPRRIKIAETKLTTLEYIREKMFPQIIEEVKGAVDRKEPIALQVATPQGSGKSRASDILALELAKMGYNVIIAVPNSNLAKEHSEFIEATAKEKYQNLQGTTCILASHEKTFSKKNPKKVAFECPYYDQIQYYAKIGCDSTYYKEKYCTGCPYFNFCPFPSQYRTAIEPDKKILILQHAHFKSKVSMHQLMTSGKQFHALIIDERFISNLFQIIKPSEAEIALIETFNYDWTERMVEWMRKGGYPTKTIYTKPDDLEMICDAFRDNSLNPERFRLLKDAYNNNEYMSAKIGINKFTPALDLPALVLTDATPAIEKIELVINRPIKQIGAGTVLDIKKYHPDNEFISVLDNRTSKSGLAKDEMFYDILNLIGHNAHTKHKGERTLVTVFLPQVQEATEYLRDKFKLDVGDEYSDAQIVVCGMKIGENTFETFTVQYILAGHYLNDKEVQRNTYFINCIDNYWREAYGRPVIQNIYYKDAMEDSDKPFSIEWEWEPVVKVEPDGVYKYPDFLIRMPKYDRDRWSYIESSGTGQQTARLRIRPGMEKPITTYDFSNEPKPGILQTQVTTIDQILSPVTY